MGIIGFANLFLLLISLRIRKDDAETISIEETKIINGFFVISIFIGHASQYVALKNYIITDLYLFMDKQVGQLCVATFLLFSGYGIMASIISKRNYIKLMPRNRMLPTYITFAVSLVIYLMVNIIFSIKYNIKTYILSLFAIESIGNSNWYIFTIMCMYITTFLLAKKMTKERMAFMQLIVSIIFIVVLKFCFNFPSRFYSTVICYPIGLIYCVYKADVDSFLRRHKIGSIFLSIIFIGIVIVSGIRANEFGYNIYALLFSVVIIWALNFFTFKSSVLLFFGKHCFSIYLLQRVSMIVLDSVFCDSLNDLVFIVISLALTITISIPFEKLTSHITNKIKEY